MIVVYITGPTHCGSTLLALLLGGHSRVCAGGELDALSVERRELRYRAFASEVAGSAIRHGGGYAARLGARCTCRAATTLACPFWSTVESQVQAIAGLELNDLDIDSADPERFARENLALFNAISTVAGTDVVVDASKQSARLRKLLRVPGLEVLPIRLVRSPYGVIFSQLRKHRPLVRSTLRYTLDEWRRQTLLLSAEPHVALQYEALAREPATTLEQLTRALGLEFEPEQRDWTRHVQHLIAGNRMRFAADGTITLDHAWRQGLRWYQKAFIALCTAPVVVRDRIMERHTQLSAHGMATGSVRRLR